MTESTQAATSLDPSSVLSPAEAAILAGVDAVEVEAHMDSGALLFETAKRGRKETRVVRLHDLADVYPHVLGRSDAQVEVDATEASDLATVVRASDASRDAVIDLARDLEVRLDLAERERQASTASLLMAQRRILDLELEARRRPWRGAGTAAACMLSLGALIAAVRVPSMVRADAEQHASALWSELAAGLSSETARLEGAFGRELAAGIASVQESSRGGTDQLAADVDRSLAELRDELLAERRALEAAAVVRETELGERATEFAEAADRDRENFAARLAEAEALTRDLRQALASERRTSAEDRARFDDALRRLERRADDDSRGHADELSALRQAVLELAEESRRAQERAEQQPAPEATPNEERAPSLVEALRALLKPRADQPAGESVTEGT